MKKVKSKIGLTRNNFDAIDDTIMNSQTFYDYLDRFRKVCLSMFEWINLPKTMNARWLEQTLYEDGIATLFKDEKYRLYKY
ncbi:MAG: hypothetical protein J6Y28_02955 [Acholeplasmatales bacterium]|nr:hypothetical protein [Acholeplasmatales bacterium]